MKAVVSEHAHNSMEMCWRRRQVWWWRGYKRRDGESSDMEIENCSLNADFDLLHQVTVGTALSEDLSNSLSLDLSQRSERAISTKQQS